MPDLRQSLRTASYGRAASGRTFSITIGTVKARPARPGSGDRPAASSQPAWTDRGAAFATNADRSPEVRKYAAFALLGLTPQVIFLIAFNCEGMENSKYVQVALHWYEWLAVETYEHVEIINQAAWYWWLLAILFVAIASWQLRKPWIFRFGNQLRSVLSAVTIASVVACSFALSTMDVAVTGSRLRATFRKSVHYAVELNLAEELRSYLERYPKQHTVIPDYINSFAKIQMDPILTEEGLAYPSHEDLRDAELEVVHDTAQIDLGNSIERNDIEDHTNSVESFRGIFSADKRSGTGGRGTLLFHGLNRPGGLRAPIHR